MKENKIKNWLRSFFYKSNGQQADWYLIGLVTFLLFFGLAILSSASSVESYRVYGDTYWHLRHQLIYGVLPGVLFFVFFAFFDYQKLRKWAFPIFLLAIFLLVLVFIPGFGSTNNTFAKSWIHLFGFSFQPAEVAKLSFILYLSSWLASRDSDVIKDAKQGFF
ncbi:MAG: FtsW/RodA/SpoVE family cell cycle protein, partial [bacterium]